MIRRSNFRAIVERRRNNYRYLIEGLDGLEGVHPLRPVLDEGTVPYVCPILFERPEPAFTRMKQARIPIVRFGEYLARDVDASLCEVSVRYANHVMQFPCHQDLTPRELDWMIDTIIEIVKDS